MITIGLDYSKINCEQFAKIFTDCEKKNLLFQYREI